jgi:ankyrin repeat protein
MKKTYAITFLCALSGLSIHTMHASDAPEGWENFPGAASATAPSQELQVLLEALQKIDADAGLNQEQKFGAMLALITPELSGEMINATGFFGATLLIVFSDSAVITQLLIHIGCDVNTGDDFNTTPLMIACGHGNTTVATELLNAGAEVNAQKSPIASEIIGETAGNTALHEAVYHCADIAIITLLLEKGADKTITNVAGKTAHALAIEKGCSPAIIALLAGE